MTAARTARRNWPAARSRPIRACASSSSAATTVRRPRWRPASSTRAARSSSPWTATCRTIPRDIGLFLEKIDEGYDIVVGLALQPAGQARLAQDPVEDREPADRQGHGRADHATTAARSRRIARTLIKAIPLYSEMHRFIPAMASIAGPRIAEIKVRHHARQFGQSKYGLSRVYKVLLDLMVIKTVASFTSRPLLLVPHAVDAVGAGRHSLRSARPPGCWSRTHVAVAPARRLRRHLSVLRLHAARQRRLRRTRLQARRCEGAPLLAPHPGISLTDADHLPPSPKSP